MRRQKEKPRTATANANARKKKTSAAMRYIKNALILSGLMVVTHAMSSALEAPTDRTTFRTLPVTQAPQLTEEHVNAVEEVVTNLYTLTPGETLKLSTQQSLRWFKDITTAAAASGVTAAQISAQQAPKAAMYAAGLSGQFVKHSYNFASTAFSVGGDLRKTLDVANASMNHGLNQGLGGGQNEGLGGGQNEGLEGNSGENDAPGNNRNPGGTRPAAGAADAFQVVAFLSMMAKLKGMR
jgi:hypothetical protein